MKKLVTIVILLLSFTEVMAQQISHTIQRGETLESIAQKYNVSVDAIKKANPNVAEMIFVGMKLTIPNEKQKEAVINNPVIQQQHETNLEISEVVQHQQPEDNNTSTPANTKPLQSQRQAGGTDVMYHAIENGWGIGLDFVISYFLFGYDYHFGKKGETLITNMGMELYVGGNYRYHVTDYFYIEGRIVAGYYNWEIKFKGKENEAFDSKVNEAFVGLSPRAGLKFGKVAISAGYRWDWIKMDFKKENCLDRFTIGLTIIL